MRPLNSLFFAACCYIYTMCECTEDVPIMDITTPRNASLSGFYKRSFAYFTIKERLPRILTQSIDILVRNKEEIGKEYGENAKEELKTVIGEISKLKYEIQTNKPMQEIRSDAPDAKLYNEFVLQQPNKTYFTAVWLHAECYMYRRIRGIFEQTQSLQSYDLFQIQKRSSFEANLAAVLQLSKYLVLKLADGQDVKSEFIKLLKLNLWGNQCDLSFSSGIVEDCSDWFQILDSLQPNIVSDQSEDVWSAVSDTNGSQIIDIVLDNSGYELFTDLCLADFLITHKFARSIRIYVKNMSWFVSDVMKRDFDWTLRQLLASDDKDMKYLGERWTKYLVDKVWVIIEDDFFTLPHDYSLMAATAPALYRQMAQAKVVIFKGDLNYRKLLGEKNWEPSTPFNVALQGFGPSKVVSLRTVKCQLICGLEPGVAEALSSKDPDWESTGKYGVIQYCDDIRKLD
uniref:Sugar phosphate phosphatase n=2 Tax=Photinus pyralis TaxID=7054 RepID=A0A1Y1NDN9_PHOPY